MNERPPAPVSRAEYDRIVRQRDIMRTALQSALEAFALIRDGARASAECVDDSGYQPLTEAARSAERARLALAAALAEARK